MTHKNEQLLLLDEDYRLLMTYIKGGAGKSGFDANNAQELRRELERAVVVSQNELPANVVRINSRVQLRDETGRSTIEITLVTPDKADIKQRKISVMAPVGVALLGFREGQKVNWWVPAGQRAFRIVSVENDRQNIPQV